MFVGSRVCRQLHESRTTLRGYDCEYRERFGKTHKCAAVLNKIVAMFDVDLFPTTKCTPLRLAMPDEFRSDNPIVSYRKFYASKPRLRYPVDKIPSWVYDYRNEPFEVNLLRWSMDKKHKKKLKRAARWKKKKIKRAAQEKLKSRKQNEKTNGHV